MQGAESLVSLFGAVAASGGVLIWSAATCRRFSSIASLSAMTEIESGDKSPHSKLGHRPASLRLRQLLFGFLLELLFYLFYELVSRP
jgi:hypothetical protein